MSLCLVVLRKLFVRVVCGLLRCCAVCDLLACFVVYLCFVVLCPRVLLNMCRLCV